jgi:hypothetical protein
MENNNKGGNFRSTIPPFTMVDNRVIENKNLSMKAKGLYLIIMHYVTIPNFTLNKRYLMSLSKEGERAFDSTWKELKDAGYLKQYRLKGEGGKWVYEYELLIEPIIENDIKEMQNKKPSTSAKVESYNNIKKNNFTNNSIPQNNKKYSPKNKENKNNTGKGASANVNNTFEKYNPKELESMLEDSQKGKFDKYKNTEEENRVDKVNITNENIENKSNEEIKQFIPQCNYKYMG